MLLLAGLIPGFVVLGMLAAGTQVAGWQAFFATAYLISLGLVGGQIFRSAKQGETDGGSWANRAEWAAVLALGVIVSQMLGLLNVRYLIPSDIGLGLFLAAMAIASVAAAASAAGMAIDRRTRQPRATPALKRLG